MKTSRDKLLFLAYVHDDVQPDYRLKLFKQHLQVSESSRLCMFAAVSAQVVVAK